MDRTPALPAEELAWARECLDAGDFLDEVADMADRPVLELARALALDKAAPVRPWRRYVPGRKHTGYVGRLPVAVVIARLKAGERQVDLAREAGVKPCTIWSAVRRYRSAA